MHVFVIIVKALVLGCHHTKPERQQWINFPNKTVRISSSRRIKTVNNLKNLTLLCPRCSVKSLEAYYLLSLLQPLQRSTSQSTWEKERKVKRRGTQTRWGSLKSRKKWAKVKGFFVAHETVRHWAKEEAREIALAQLKVISDSVSLS